MKKFLLLWHTLMLALLLAACGGAPAHTLTYERGELTETEINGEAVPSIYVYTEYANNSGEAALPADEVSVKVYQHGVEQTVFVLTGEKFGDYSQCDASVQAGSTAKIVWTFEREDDSEVTVELSDGSTYTITK